MSLDKFRKYICLIIVIAISGSIIFFSNSIKMHILGMIVLCVGSMLIVKLDFAHPYVWYSGIFTLYSISYPILYLAGYHNKYGYTNELMIIQWIALVTFLIVVSPLDKIKLNTNSINIKNKNGRIVINVIIVMILIGSVIIKSAGYSGKNDIYLSNNTFLNLVFLLSTLLIVMYTFELVNYINKCDSIDVKLIFKVCLSLAILVMFSGERDIIFRTLVVTVMILYILGKLKNKHVMLMLPVGMLMLPLSHIYKYFFLTGNISGNMSFKLKDLLLSFLDGEFVSASRNMQILLNNESFTKGFLEGKGILNDFARIFLRTDFSNGMWFHNTFFTNSRTGYGFTMVGEGYINFGYMGVILVFTIIGLFIRYLYKNAARNIYYLTAYIYAIPLYMYAVRADLANIFSQFVKHLLLSLVLVCILKKIPGIVIKKSNNNQVHN
ncbi:O-antigen polymerase [Clostridium sp.]|uniref:O-antigen polymerase n=1 Tax=Clostridium sp. TaxID=1506 RepID=UPI001B5EABB1|nr:O-antigen polymerase [Clostridium sp.]MBP3917179.1 oligosaccharide repeat unit polymerase [Clostridium sp.]